MFHDTHTYIHTHTRTPTCTHVHMPTHRVTFTDMTITHDKIHDSNYNNIPAMTVNIFSTPIEVFKIIPCRHDDVFVSLFCLIVAGATHTTYTHSHCHVDNMSLPHYFELSL
jgi:hypothetical protein